MECKTVQALLQASRPGGDDLIDPELAGAAAHLADCPECTGYFGRQQAFDLAAAAAMRSVPVPARLRERIDERLNRRAVRSRQWRIARWAVAAACLGAATLYWWPARVEQPTPLASKVLAEELADRDELEVVAFQPVPSALRDPAAIEQWCRQTLQKLRLPPSQASQWPIQDLVGIGLTNYHGRPVAVFQFDGRHGPSDVIALPRSQFTTDLRLEFQLVHKTRDLVVIAWTEQDAAFFAILKGWAPEQWKRLLAPARGLT